MTKYGTMAGSSVNVPHELDGIKYDGDKERTQEQLSSLPGCDRFHTGWFGTAKKEILPFIEALNPGDTVFCLFNTHLSKLGNYANSKYKNIELNYALIGALQDRVLIITQHGGRVFTIYYTEIDYVLNDTIASLSRINIVEKNGTKTDFFLDTVGTDAKLLGNRFCSWVNQKTETSEEIEEPLSRKEKKKDQQYAEGSLPSQGEAEQLWAEANLEEFKPWESKEEEEKSEGEARLPSSNHLESWRYSYDMDSSTCGSCGKKFESRNKLFDHLKEFPDHAKTVRESVDVRDRELIERIREKYKAPEYEAPSEVKTVYPAYPNYLSFLTFVLYCLGFLVVILYAYRSEGADGEYYGQTWDNPVIYSVNNITIGYVQLYLFALFGSLILGSYILYKNSGRELEKSPDILGVPGLVAITLLFFVIPIIYFFSDFSLTIPCCSTFFLLLTVLLLETPMVFHKNENVRKEEEEKIKKRGWFDAHYLENKNEFSDATRIWSDLGEDEQVLRVDGLLLEYQYVRVRRRILDMEEKGINCTKLKDHLDIATLLAEDREQGAISFEARIK